MSDFCQNISQISNLYFPCKCRCSMTYHLAVIIMTFMHWIFYIQNGFWIKNLGSSIVIQVNNNFPVKYWNYRSNSIKWMNHTCILCNKTIDKFTLWLQNIYRHEKFNAAIISVLLHRKKWNIWFYTKIKTDKNGVISLLSYSNMGLSRHCIKTE